MLSEVLKRLRFESDCSQQDLADVLGVKRQTYSAYERDLSVPDANTLLKIAEYFDVSLDYLLERTEIREIATESEKPDTSNSSLQPPIIITQINDMFRNFSMLSDENKAKAIEYIGMLKELEERKGDKND